MNISKIIPVLLSAFFAVDASACMTFVAGKKVSATGRVIVGHNEDDWPPFTVHHGMIPARSWPEGTRLPASSGCCSTIPQAPRTLACYWGEVKFPEGDLNADTFLNEKGVLVVSDSGGNSTERMDDPTLLTEGGIKFNLRRAVGERATSARATEYASSASLSRSTATLLPPVFTRLRTRMRRGLSRSCTDATMLP